MGVAKKAVKCWTIRDHRKHWDSLSGFKQAKEKGKRELLKLNRNQL
jgi:hypothetical protein